MRIRQFPGAAIAAALCLAGFAPEAAAEGWEIEIHGGGLTASSPGGSGSLPGPGPVIPEWGGPTRAVPSWYFGDGTALFNEVARLPGLPQLQGLDPVLQSGVLERGTGPTLGVRVSRRVSPRFRLE